MASTNVVGPTYAQSQFIRHPLTSRNHDELDIPGRVDEILGWEGRTWETGKKLPNYVKMRAQQNGEKNVARYVLPTGFSLMTRSYGDFPDDELTAAERGWDAFLNVGAPLIEERSDIVQPPPEVISEQIYVARGSATATSWTDSVQFQISNTCSWSLDGSTRLTFGGKVAGTLQQQLALGLQASQAMAQQQTVSGQMTNSAGSETGNTLKTKMTPERVGMEGDNSHKNTNSSSTANTTTGQSTVTGTGVGTVNSTTSASGTGELNGALEFGIRSDIRGSLTSSWSQTSTLTGTLASRAVVRATQRRQVKRFDYQLPITLGGYVALYYPEPVDIQLPPYTAAPGMTVAERGKVQATDPSATRTAPRYTQVVVFPVEILGIVKDKENFTQKGWAEVVSTLVGEHEVFELETLKLAGRDVKDTAETVLYKY